MVSYSEYHNCLLYHWSSLTIIVSISIFVPVRLTRGVRAPRASGARYDKVEQYFGPYSPLVRDVVRLEWPTRFCRQFQVDIRTDPGAESSPPKVEGRQKERRQRGRRRNVGRQTFRAFGYCALTNHPFPLSRRLSRVVTADRDLHAAARAHAFRNREDDITLYPPAQAPPAILPMFFKFAAFETG